MFMELYYEHYKENCKGCYWEEEKTLPYSILIQEREKREELEKVLLDNGFECVVYENGYPLMYVNLTLKRFGRNEKACGSSTINHAPMSLDQFKTEILIPYLERENTTKTVMYMSYLEAHKIFHDYIDALVCNGQREEVPFYRKSAFKNSKEEIMYAYKVFMAVAYRYGNGIYLEREVERYNMMVSALGMPWVDDEFADGYVECERILNDNSLWGKFKNRTAQPYVKEKLDRLTKELFINTQGINPVDVMMERDAFTEAILKLVNESVQRAKALPEDSHERKQKLTEILDDYCLGAYDVIGLTIRQEDINCFYPLPTLYKLSTHPTTSAHFSPEQKKYIALHRNR